MLFSSQLFILGFLPVALGGFYALAPYRAWRQGWVVLASLVFYGWWDFRFVPLLVGLTLANWLVVQWFAHYRAGFIPVFGVALNLARARAVQIRRFLPGTAFALLGEGWHPWDLVLPLGISFFVFQKISYLIDLKRGDPHIYGLLDFCMFVTFFPQLIAGPLVRHNEIIDQFRADPRRPEMWENLSRGFVLFVIGLAKKIALADTLAQIADPLFQQARGAHAHRRRGMDRLRCLHAADLLRFLRLLRHGDRPRADVRPALPLNFNAPYRAVSVRDFWRRWHMTLSRFLRDYLYIPLGGNRCGPVRQAVNVVLTMLLGGLVAWRELDVRRLGRRCTARRWPRITSGPSAACGCPTRPAGC